MEQGQLIAVDGKLYEYVRWVEKFKTHEVAIVEVDEDGMLTATYIHDYIKPDKMAEGIGKANFTKEQWYGIVGHFIREGNFHLNEEEIEDATEDIVERCFVYEIPKFHELPNYIAEYMNR